MVRLCSTHPGLKLLIPLRKFSGSAHEKNSSIRLSEMLLSGSGRKHPELHGYEYILYFTSFIIIITGFMPIFGRNQLFVSVNVITINTM